MWAHKTILLAFNSKEVKATQQLLASGKGFIINHELREAKSGQKCRQPYVWTSPADTGKRKVKGKEGNGKNGRSLVQTQAEVEIKLSKLYTVCNLDHRRCDKMEHLIPAFLTSFSRDLMKFVWDPVPFAKKGKCGYRTSHPKCQRIF